MMIILPNNKSSNKLDDVGGGGGGGGMTGIGFGWSNTGDWRMAKNFPSGVRMYDPRGDLIIWIRIPAGMNSGWEAFIRTSNAKYPKKRMIFLLLEYSTYDFEVRPIEQRFPVVLNVLIFYLLFDNYHIMNKEIQ